MIPYQEQTQSVVRILGSNENIGLSHEQAQERLSRYGENKRREEKKRPWILRFFRQCKNAMVPALFLTAGISFWSAAQLGAALQYVQSAVIFLMPLLHILLGMMGERKGEKALTAMHNQSSGNAKVLRGGEEHRVDASLLVPGDIIFLEAGDGVPADARLLATVLLKCDESSLTGDIRPVEKEAELQLSGSPPVSAQRNMVFAGCAVLSGTAKAVVTNTGLSTEAGRIEGELGEEVQEQRLVPEELNLVGGYLSLLALAVCILVLTLAILYKKPLGEILTWMVLTAVAALPESLPLSLFGIWSGGVQRIDREQAVVRKLSALKDLGRTSVICVDKGGILTRQEMTVEAAYASAVKGIEPLDKSCSNEVKRLMCFSTLCCNTAVTIEDSGLTRYTGDSTERAIVAGAKALGFEKAALNHSFPRREELPFDPQRKLMTTVNEISGANVVIVKGAFDVLLTRCAVGDMKLAVQQAEAMCAMGLRVLAVAYKELEIMPRQLTSETLEQNLTFMGLVGLRDQLREGVREAVKDCLTAGIQPVMITGDYQSTAKAIAKALGIYQEGDFAVTGKNLGRMSDELLEKAVTHIPVYARISPENKVRIVEAWKRNGQVVAVTGEGVQDIPALKAAQIGCVTGSASTDVTKSAAEIVLKDDRFGAIVAAVRMGRRITDNTKKVIRFMVGTKLGTVLSVLAAMLIWQALPFGVLPLLWINLVQEGLLSMALGTEALEPEEDRNPEEENPWKDISLRGCLDGLVCMLLTLGAFAVGFYQGGVSAGQTLSFFVMSVSRVVQAFNLRSGQSLLKRGFFSNPGLNLAALGSLALTAVLLGSFLAASFQLTKLTRQLYLVGAGMALLPLGISELQKAIGRVHAAKQGAE